MNLFKAINLSLGDISEPVITPYRLSRIIHTLYRKKEFRGDGIIKLQKPFATPIEYSRVLGQLVENGVLAKHPDFSNHAYNLLGRKDSDPGEVVCAIDPFCYLSHLSAMSHLGLTNRMPTVLFVSSPKPAAWKHLAHERMQKDLQKELEMYLKNGLPELKRFQMDKIGRRDIHRFSSTHHGAYTNAGDRGLRVSSVGRTFLDMLRTPDLCGGMRHVVEVFEEHAQMYLQLIIDELEQHGGPIDKVRSGYILEEKMGLNHKTIESWTRFAQRGGSRRLDAGGEYENVWSDKWMLSLNLY